MSSANCNNDKPIAVVFDLDNTITRFDTYVSFLLSVLYQRPQRVVLSVWLPCAVMLHKLGIKDNTWLKKVFLKTIVGGAKRYQVNHWANQFVAKTLGEGIYPNALLAIEQHKQSGHRLILATASFDFYVIQLGQQLGFDEIICTRSSWNDVERLKGDISGENCYGKAKLNGLKDLFCQERDQWHIIGYSDHHSDEPMLEWVDQPIAVNPTSQLEKIAGCRHYDIKKW